MILMMLGVIASSLVCFSPTSSYAIDLRGVLTGYTITSWDVSDGAPEGTVYALAQDRDGYLWLGTYTGLHRFDGTRFRPWSSLSPHVLPSELVQALYVSRDGGLWVGFGAGGGVSLIRGIHVVRTFSSEDGLPRFAVNTILEDHAGVLWAGTDAGLFFLNGERWHKLSAAGGLPDGAIWGAHVDRTGTLLVAADAGLFRRSAGSSRFEMLERFRASSVDSSVTVQPNPLDEQIWTPRLASDNVVRSIATDATGLPFVSDLRYGFRPLRGERATPSTHPGRGLQLMFDRRGDMWVATGGQGVWRVGLSSDSGNVVERVTAATGLATEGASSLLEDRQGNIWAGGSPSGLTRLMPQKFIPVTLEGSVTALIASPEQRVWVGTSDALIDMPAPWRFPLVQHRHLVGESIRALHLDAQGSIWAATERQLLRKRKGRDSFEAVPGGDVLRHVDSITSDPQGGVLLADGERGLLKWSERAGLQPVVLPRELAGTRFVTAYADSRKRVWLASAAGRVGVLDESGRVTVFNPEQGFTAGVARIIHEDPRGVMWFGGPNGVTRYEQEGAVTISGDDRLPIRLVRGITDDGEGYLWVATTSGLIRIHHTEAQKAAADATYRPAYALFD
jgi:ligand-binding sensor domain-containing protein